MSGRALAILIAAVLATAGLLGAALQLVGRERRTISVGGLRRSYVLHIPADLSGSKPASLVLVFHGGGGTGRQIAAHTGFSRLADREGFIVAYPDAVRRSWNDGREDMRQEAVRTDVDDVAFVSALIDAVAREHPIDPNRIYATGISNGACFANYLAAKLSRRIAAIAPVAGSIGTAFESKFRPDEPVSVLMINGAADPLIRYEGGPVLGGSRGSVIPVERAVELWLRADGIGAEPETGSLPDRDPTDGCRASWRLWKGGSGGTDVELVKIVGGGHTWPGATQYLPKSMIGNLCRDFSATEMVWQFFKAHPKNGTVQEVPRLR